jgi:hypothetical protein
MTEHPQFCDAHKRWFRDECDWCAVDAEIAQSHKRWQTAWAYAVVLTAHSGCGHLITDVIPLPDGRKMTILELQMMAFALEHEAIL